MKKIITIKGLCFITSCLLSLTLYTQSEYGDFYLRKETYERNLPVLREQFAGNKTFPAQLELECLVALSFYPELKNTAIEFRFGKSNFTMTSKPKFNSILKGKQQRQYVVTIEKLGSSKNNIEWKDLSFNAMVGWIGHELGHIVHYSHKTNSGVAFIGVKYAFPGYRRKMERFTDQIAIQHDLGYALYEGVDYTMNRSHATEHYKTCQQKYYLQPEEIIDRIHSRQTWSAVFRKTKMIQGTCTN
jgi:hypothetical protein